MKAVSLVLVLMFFGVVAGEAIVETGAVMRFFDRSRADFRKREALRDTLDELLLHFDGLVGLDADDENHPELEGIRGSFAAYQLIIRDVSSGFNLNFLPASLLSDPGIAAFLFVGGTAESFLTFRRNRGFVTDTTEWRAFLREEAADAVVCYGWFSTLHEEAETAHMLMVSSGRTAETVFPLMNDLPLINVNTMDTALLAPLLARRSWNITNAAMRAAALQNRLEQGPVTESELRSALGLPETHEIYRYLGVRTAFWALSFTNGRYRMDAVIAAVPERESRVIERYVLIEGKVRRER